MKYSNMLRSRGPLAVFFLTLLPVLSAWAQKDPVATGLEIAQEAKRRDTGYQDFVTEVTMILRNKAGQESSRKLFIKTIENESKGEKSLLVFQSPADVDGTALLTFSSRTEADDQWLYLPATKRVRRIATGSKTGSFVGSEFTYEDISPQQVEKYTYRYIRDEAFEGQTCFVVERYPTDPKSGYKRQVTWLDQTEYRPLKVDFYDSKDAHVKTLHFRGYQKYLDKFWRPDEMLMENKLSGKSTKLVFQNYKFRTGLKESDFDQNALDRLR